MLGRGSVLEMESVKAWATVWEMVLETVSVQAR
jgi:hypothetical protein